MKEIDKLIEKYFAGETTPEEEELLKVLLRNAESEKYAEIKQMLDTFDYLSDKNLDYVFENLNDNEETRVKSGVPKDEGLKPSLPPPKLRFGKKSYFVAAAIILIVSMLILDLPLNEKRGKVINDENLAMNIDLARAEVSDAFSLVSEKMDAAFGGLEAIDKVNFEALEKLNLINKYQNK